MTNAVVVAGEGANPTSTTMLKMKMTPPSIPARPPHRRTIFSMINDSPSAGIIREGIGPSFKRLTSLIQQLRLHFLSFVLCRRTCELRQLAPTDSVYLLPFLSFLLQQAPAGKSDPRSCTTPFLLLFSCGSSLKSIARETAATDQDYPTDSIRFPLGTLCSPNTRPCLPRQKSRHRFLRFCKIVFGIVNDLVCSNGA